MNPTGGAGGGGTTGGGTGTADACSTAANWEGASLKFDVSDSPHDFAQALNPLVRAQKIPAISVTNHMLPHCVWMVAFSADDASSTEHAATYTEMFRHPAGLWTAAPQPNGWLRVVDAAQQTVWIPIADLTGSATFGATDCSSLSKADASATIPRSAASIAITTGDGPTTLGDLLGKRTSSDGWHVRFTFSADLSR
jgi:hypothetical protein